MKELYLYRACLPRATLGFMRVDGVLFHTLERPWLDNKPNVSCIPAGSYAVKRNVTGKFQYYGIQDVPGRTHIEIHPANSVDQLAGCIALGFRAESVNGRIGDSVLACCKFLELIGDNDFTLNIVEV